MKATTVVLVQANGLLQSSQGNPAWMFAWYRKRNPAVGSTVSATHSRGNTPLVHLHCGIVKDSTQQTQQSMKLRQRLSTVGTVADLIADQAASTMAHAPQHVVYSSSRVS